MLIFRFNIVLILLLLASVSYAAKEEIVEMGGMSIIGNRELPKSLYIVPWKDSGVGIETDLSKDLLNEGLDPVDPDVFVRQLNYYDLNHK